MPSATASNGSTDRIGEEKKRKEPKRFKRERAGSAEGGGNGQSANPAHPLQGGGEALHQGKRSAQFLGHGRGLRHARRANAQPLYAPRIGFKNFKLETAMRNDFSTRRHAA